MRGYVEAQEARARGLGLSEVEQAMLRDRIQRNEQAVADAELDLIVEAGS